MKRVNFLSAIILVIAVLLLLSCEPMRLVDYTIISSKNAYLPIEKRGPNVEGKDCGIVKPANVKQAIDNAIEQAGIDFNGLIDGVIYIKTTYFFFGVKQCYIVSGTAVKFQSERDKNASIVPHSRFAEFHPESIEAQKKLCMTLPADQQANCLAQFN